MKITFALTGTGWAEAKDGEVGPTADESELPELLA